MAAQPGSTVASSGRGGRRRRLSASGIVVFVAALCLSGWLVVQVIRWKNTLYWYHAYYGYHTECIGRPNGLVGSITYFFIRVRTRDTMDPATQEYYSEPFDPTFPGKLYVNGEPHPMATITSDDLTAWGGRPSSTRLEKLTMWSLQGRTVEVEAFTWEDKLCGVTLAERREHEMASATDVDFAVMWPDGEPVSLPVTHDELIKRAGPPRMMHREWLIGK